MISWIKVLPLLFTDDAVDVSWWLIVIVSFELWFVVKAAPPVNAFPADIVIVALFADVPVGKFVRLLPSPEKDVAVTLFNTASLPDTITFFQPPVGPPGYPPAIIYSFKCSTFYYKY